MAKTVSTETSGTANVSNTPTETLPKTSTDNTMMIVLILIGAGIVAYIVTQNQRTIKLD